MDSDDDKEFEKILDATHVHVRAYIAGTGVGSDQVDDLAQETYIELYRHFDRIPADIEPVRWLKGIAKRLCLNHFREEKVRGTHLKVIAGALLQSGTSWRELPGESEARDALDRCMEKLSRNNRHIVTKRYIEGDDSSVIARAAGTSAEAVRIRLFRIRNALRECVSNILQREPA